ncbi:MULTISPECIES: hypothetical protein [Bradyrhizobium]|uniref:Uncharacterized protein n=2 Tax=Bradyrhizobium vignae TaxID=1549949 RepID=A0A2U3PU60_9BRAD|nr:hypothetical protein [Bradyrhizobium vignae]SPP92682.1 conserved membrane protein of unknown function [Bradyrhizobium vignae]
MSAVFSISIEAKLLAPQLRLVSVSYPELRRGGGGRRDQYIYAHGATTMLAIGLVLNTLGIGLFCWAIFTLAVYALPFFVALSIGITAYQRGAGLVGTPLIATAGGTLTLVLGQVAFAATRSSALRIAIATAFAVPAAVAGYHVVFALSQIGAPSLAGRDVFACLGAVCIGLTSWTRLMVLAKPRPFEPGEVVENPS